MKIFSIFILIIVSGCGISLNSIKAEKLGTISLGMSKTEVVGSLGEPTVARGSIRNKYNQVVEIWEYKMVVEKDTTVGQELGKLSLTFFTFGMAGLGYKSDVTPYWLYFYDNQLAQWGEAGDWSKEPDRIYQFDFAPKPRINK